MYPTRICVCDQPPSFFPYLPSAFPFPPFLRPSRNVLRNGSIVKDISASRRGLFAEKSFIFLVNIRSIKVEVFRQVVVLPAVHLNRTQREEFGCFSGYGKYFSVPFTRRRAEFVANSATLAISLYSTNDECIRFAVTIVAILILTTLGNKRYMKVNKIGIDI